MKKSLPDYKEARRRTKEEVKHIYLDESYDRNSFKNQKYFLKQESPQQIY